MGLAPTGTITPFHDAHRQHQLPGSSSALSCPVAAQRANVPPGDSRRRCASWKGVIVPVGARPIPGGGCTPGSSRGRLGGYSPSKALGVNGLFQQFSESAGQNASELSSRPRKRELWKPTHHRHGEGRCRPSRAQPGLVGSTGVMTLARDKGNDHATREDRRGDRVLGGQTGGSREIDRATAGVGQAHSTVEAG